jgi:cell wall-active antibiotic response 4TMS protein YvqF
VDERRRRHAPASGVTHRVRGGHAGRAQRPLLTAAARQEQQRRRRRTAEWFGHIKLDLRQAQISAAETHIHARALFGNVDLLVPEGVEVEVQARTQVRRTDLKGSSGIPGAPRLVLTGGTFFGDIKVRHRRLWEKLGRRARFTD